MTSTASTIDISLQMLTSQSRAELAVRWESIFGVPAPKSCQATLLRGALAWHLQMQALKAAVGTREATQAAKSLQRAAAGSGTSLSAGTRLLREWQGRTHHVTVVAGGFEYDGRVWTSLSAIARAITGTRWSGPAFFGVRS